MKQIAYILTSKSIAERVSDSKALATQLESLDVFDRVELVPAIFWDDEQAVVRFLAEYPVHSWTPPETGLFVGIMIPLRH